VNSPVSIKCAESKRNIIKKLDKIIENLYFKESSDQSDIGSEESSDSSSNYSEGDFTARYGDVSYSSEDEWMLGLELYDDEPTIFSSDANHKISNQHQVYTILEETLEEFDKDNNPLINPLNIRKGAKYIAEGETEATVVVRVKVRLTTAKWETIKAAVNHGAVIPPESTREVLMGYQYALHRQGKRLLQEISEI
jgi:hypothetical protein